MVGRGTMAIRVVARLWGGHPRPSAPVRCLRNPPEHREQRQQREEARSCADRWWCDKPRCQGDWNEERESLSEGRTGIGQHVRDLTWHSLRTKVVRVTSSANPL